MARLKRELLSAVSEQDESNKRGAKSNFIAETAYSCAFCNFFVAKTDANGTEQKTEPFARHIIIR